MALTGSFTHYSYEPHPTDTISRTITYPSDLPEQDSDYELRGTSVEVEEPVSIETATTISGSYVYIKAASVQTVGVADSNLVNLYYIYNIYNSQEHKNSDFDNPIYTDGISTNWDYDSNSNPTEVAYLHLKSQKGSENLTDY